MEKIIWRYWRYKVVSKPGTLGNSEEARPLNIANIQRKVAYYQK